MLPRRGSLSAQVCLIHMPAQWGVKISYVESSLLDIIVDPSFNLRNIVNMYSVPLQFNFYLLHDGLDLYCIIICQSDRSAAELSGVDWFQFWSVLVLVYNYAYCFYWVKIESEI